MKIKAHVIEVSDAGDTLLVVMQGKEPTAADWQPWSKQSVNVRITNVNRRAFYIGREVLITVEPK